MSKFNYFQKGDVAIRVASDEWFDDNTPIRVFKKNSIRYYEFKDMLGNYMDIFNEECFVGNDLYDISFINPAFPQIPTCGSDPLSDEYNYCEKISQSIHTDLMGYGRGWY